MPKANFELFEDSNSLEKLYTETTRQFSNIYSRQRWSFIILKLRFGCQLAWYQRHVIGVLLLLFPSLPAIVAAFSADCVGVVCPSGGGDDSLSGSCVASPSGSDRREMLITILSASALHHTNFSNLSSNMRTLIALLILLTSYFISAFYLVSKNSSKIFLLMFTQTRLFKIVFFYS